MLHAACCMLHVAGGAGAGQSPADGKHPEADRHLSLRPAAGLLPVLRKPCRLSQVPGGCAKIGCECIHSESWPDADERQVAWLGSAVHPGCKVASQLRYSARSTKIAANGWKSFFTYWTAQRAKVRVRLYVSQAPVQMRPPTSLYQCHCRRGMGRSLFVLSPSDCPLLAHLHQGWAHLCCSTSSPGLGCSRWSPSAAELDTPLPHLHQD
jgi:hypothetical protein